MFKSKKKRQQQKAEAQAEAQAQAAMTAVAAANELKNNNINKYKLDDINITHDFRSSVILPQLNKNLDLKQFHSLQQLDIASSSTLLLNSRNENEEPVSPTSVDGSKQYQDLAAWRHLRSQNRYSNGLFGGKQRGRPKPSSRTHSEKAYQKSPLSIDEEEIDSVNDHLGSFTPVEYNENKNGGSNKEREEQEEDAILEEEPFEPDSDMEENYFFHDFSADAVSSEKKSKIQNKKRRASAKSNKQLSLSSLARELNANRLSVIQPRESRIIMTEEDEQELTKLLELQKQRISIYNNDYSRSPSPSPSPSSPIPSLPTLSKYDGNKQAKERAGKRRSSAFDIRSLRKSIGIKENDMNESHIQFGSEQARPTNNDNDIATEDNAIQSVTRKNIVSSLSNVSQLAHQQHGSTLSLANSLKRSVSVTSTLSNKLILPETTLNYIQENENSYNANKTHTISGHRRSLSMDAMSVKLELDDSFDIEAWRWTRANSIQSNGIKPETNDIIQPQLPHSLAGPSNKTNSYHHEKNGNNDDDEEEKYEEEVVVPEEAVHKEQKSFGLFGGFRSANKSRSNPGSVSLKGFVRNLSSTNISASAKAEKRSERGMSRAAATALQHSDSKDDLNNNNINHPLNLEEAIENKPKSKKDRKRTTSDNGRVSNNGGAVRLLSQLLSRSSKQKKDVKTINVEEKAASDTKKRAQVVRRTIIYVQPGSSLDFLKTAEDRNSGITIGNTNTNVNEGYSPLPALNDGKIEISEGGLPIPSLASPNSSVSDGSTPLDDETADSCALKTKQARQLSIKKQVDQSSDVGKPSHERLNFNEKYPQHNSDNNDQLINQMNGRSNNKANSQTSRESHYMQGVELREMSDGSVVWGIVKKEGNRVSFFSPDNQNNTQYNYMHDETKEEEEEEEAEYDRFSDFERESRTTYSSISENSKNYNVPAAIPSYCFQPPPPIPKRSSLRRSPTSNSDNRKRGNAQNISTPPPEEASTADIYYADDITLPSLLKLMRDQEKNTSDQSLEDDENSYLYQKNAIPSVDEQLEEMMRSLTTQEKLNRA